MKKFLCVALIVFVSGCGPRWGDGTALQRKDLEQTSFSFGFVITFTFSKPCDGVKT